ncbi:MAG: type II toxin-antitoxin system VapC family toxin [Dehalococcoidia bacterium]
MASAADPPSLIDIDIFIDDARGIPAATAFLTARLAAGDLRMSVMSAMELVQGCRDRAALARVRQLLQSVTIVPVDAATSQTALQLMDTYFLSHGLLIADALIAATALEHGLTLYTRNVRDFQMIPSLIVKRPY